MACVDMASGEREAFLANKTNRRFVFPTADLPFHESNAVGRAKAFTVAFPFLFICFRCDPAGGSEYVPVSSTFTRTRTGLRRLSLSRSRLPSF